MDSFFTLCLGIGIGVGAGTLGAASGRCKGLVSPVGIAAIVIGIAAAVLIADARADSLILAGLGALAGGLVAVSTLGGFVIAAGRRAGGGAGLALWVALFGLAVAGLSLLWAPLALPAFIALIWLGISRRRREPRKYKGLRSLT